ncbi:C-factor-like isoform X1 [Brienomyrus brachyistius]|uniref:C-factor-like isoform X1 n=1 Tax=Brienomyrus brachyistius TaxID=42636 RepID=UPI0020B2DBF4|nr:C-factor-like isoform X1 [Brienomyrus brachyistius]
MMSGVLSGCRSVLVTGASRGIGLQIVKDLAKKTERPALIIATARNPAAAEELQRVAKESSGVHVVNLDVTSQASIDAAVEEASSLLGAEGLNCLINNAAIGKTMNLEMVTAEEMLKTYEINTVAPLMVTKAFLPLLRAAATRGSGMGIHRAAVINMSTVLGSIQLNFGSVLGPLAEFKWYPYKASKAALNMVTRCLAVDLESEGILCVAVHPGWVRTDMGGPQADLSVEESASSILSVLAGLSEKDHGGYLDYTGKTLPW